MQPYSEKQNESPSSLPSVPWGWRDVGGVLALVIVGLVTIFVVVRVVVKQTGIQVTPGMTSPINYIVGVMIYILLLLGIYLFAARQAGWKALGLVWPPWWALALTLPLLVAELFGMAIINALVALLTGAFENPQIESLTGGQSTSPQMLLLLLVLVAGIVPVAEELFFRGMLYPLLRQRWGASIAILSNAAIFAVLHFVPIIIPALFFVGLILALLREWSGSTVPCIVLHMMQNGFVVIAINMMLAS
jgi:hypothetical protein